MSFYVNTLKQIYINESKDYQKMVGDCIKSHKKNCETCFLDIKRIRDQLKIIKTWISEEEKRKGEIK